jgi:hypothetical protein
MTEAQKNFFEGMTEEQKDFFGAVLEELIRAEKKHKSWPDDAVHAASILNEEAGKLTQACNDYKFCNSVPHDPYDRMNKKAVSTAAMALRFWHGMGAY